MVIVSTGEESGCFLSGSFCVDQFCESAVCMKETMVVCIAAAFVYCY